MIAVRSSATSGQGLDETLSVSFSWLWENNSAFMSWMRSPSKLFWVGGTAGSGKTTLMRHVAAHPSRIVAATPSRRRAIVTAYFFSSQAGNLERSIEGLLRSLVHQLLRQDPVIFKKMYPTINNASEFKSTLLPWSVSQLESAILLAVEGLPEIQFLFLVDGLDEYGGEAATIARFARLFSSHLPPNAKICVSGRPYSEFQFELNSIPRLLVESHNSNDIYLYITSRLLEIQSSLGDDYQMLRNIVAEKANGMFLWVRLAMDSLQRGWRKYEDVAALTRRLQEMPRDLVDFYQRILDEMEPEDKAESIRLLVLFSTASEELSCRGFFQSWYHTSNECMHSGSTQCHSPSPLQLLEEPVQDQALRRFEGRVYALTRSLIQVSQDPSGREPTRFFLLHETVQSFIRQRLLDKSQQGPLGRPILGHGLLLHACVHSLDHLFTKNSAWIWTLEPNATTSWSEWEDDYFDLGSIYLNYDDYINRCQQYQWTTPSSYPFEFGFFHYAVENLLKHAQLAELEPQSHDYIMNQFSGKTFELWRRLYQIHQPSDARTLPVNLLGLAIAAGLRRYAEYRILALPPQHPRTPAYWSDRSYDYSQDLDYLLFEAARAGDVHSARLLISRGARVWLEADEMRRPPEQDGRIRYPLGSLRHWGEAALSRAVAYDRGEMVTFLLSSGASTVQKLTCGFNYGWVVSGGIKRCRVLSLDAISLTLKRSRLSVSGGRSYYSIAGGSSRSAAQTGTSRPALTTINGRDFVGSDALSFAIRRGSRGAFTAILPFATAARLQETLNAALAQAARNAGDKDYVVELLRCGADATWYRRGDSCESGGKMTACYALSEAVLSRSAANITALLQSGADPNFDIPADACSREHLDRQGIPIPVPHKSPMDLLMEHLTTAATNEGNLDEKYTNLARLMLRYGARIDHHRWGVYVRPERKAYIMSKLFPTVDTT